MRLQLRLLALFLLSTALLMSQAGLAVAQQNINAQLDPVAGSGVSGTATVAAADGQDALATLSVDVQGLVAGQSYQVLLRAGTCALPSASTGVLGNLVADSAGRASLTTTSVQFSAAGTVIDLTLGLLADGDHIIQLQGQETVACGAISAASPTPGVIRLPVTGGLPLSPVTGVLGLIGLIVFALGLLLARPKSRDHGEARANQTT